MLKYHYNNIIMPLILLALFVQSAIGVLQPLETTATSNGLDCNKFLHVNESSICPPWTIFNKNKSICECGDSIGFIVRCTKAKCTPFMARPIKFRLAECYCMSYNDKLDMEVVGACPYLCTTPSSIIPQNRTELNNRCNFLIRQNRTGELCGRCVDGYAPSAYSSGLQCANCSNYQRNWIKYIAIAYLPLILLYVVVLLFRINALSARMAVSIFICQIISCPPIATTSSIYFNSNVSHGSTFINHFFHNHHEFIQGSVKYASLFYGVWNLDFYRYSFEPLCLYPNISTLQVLSLDYLIALFPILLIVITFFMVKLYDRFKLLQYFWWPVIRLTALLGKLKCDLNVSLIETFGTFMLLSYVKVINSSLSILMPVHVRNVTGHIVSTNVYYNGSQEYFGHDHLPYAVLAIFMFTTFNLMPLFLLCLYPSRCFQSCLNCCRFNSHVLRTFMDAFQGCYKFEPYDCRYWAAFYLFLRIAILVIFALTQSGYLVVVTGILLVPVTSFLLVVRPYREGVYNIIDSVMLLTLILLCFSAAGFSLFAFDQRYAAFVYVMFGIGVLSPPTYAILLLIKNITPKNLLATSKKYILRIVLQREDERLQSNGSNEEPLLRELGDSAESEDSQLLSDKDPHYNSLLEYT